MMVKLNIVAEPGKHDILITRDFNAPRDLVFKALCDPKLVSQWWGPKETTTVVDQMDVRKGGIWRYVQRDHQGNEYGFNGVYHEVCPYRMVYTFEFEGMPGHVLMETVTLEEHDGKTRLKDLSVFQSVEDRDGMIQSGMESGATDSWDRLDEVLKNMS
jgi:uncharacterized protein YndB with AHSA1/START domain